MAGGTSVAFYNDPAYVRISSAANLKTEVENLGHTVTTFTGVASGDFQAALAGNDVLMLPRSDVAPPLSAPALQVIRDHVSAGGGLIASGYGSYLVMNSALGYHTSYRTITQRNVTFLNAGAAAGTPFAGGPSVLEKGFYVQMLHSSTLPAGARNLYTYDSAGTLATSVFSSEYGTGRNVFLGFDWYTGAAPSTWRTALESSLAYTAPVAVIPEPVTMLGVVAGIAGLGGYLRRRRP